MVAENVPTKTFQKTLDILHMYGLYKKNNPSNCISSNHKMNNDKKGATCNKKRNKTKLLS